MDGFECSMEIPREMAPPCRGLLGVQELGSHKRLRRAARTKNSTARVPRAERSRSPLVSRSTAEHNPSVVYQRGRGDVPGISIHVVDVSRGVVATGMRVELFAVAGDAPP